MSVTGPFWDYCVSASERGGPNDRSLVDIRCYRPSRGAGVVSVVLGSGVEVPALATRVGGGGRSYDPRQEAPELLHEFTRLSPSAEEYADFASKYGLLGLTRLARPPRKSGYWHRRLDVECVADWETAILELRTVGELHGALVKRDTDALRRLIDVTREEKDPHGPDDWTNQDSIFFFFSPSVEKVKHHLVDAPLGEFAIPPQAPLLWDEPSYESALLRPFFPFRDDDDDLEVAGWNLLANAVNTRTLSFTGLALVPKSPDIQHGLEQRVACETLFGWLWLQFAEQVATNKPMQQCIGCDVWYFQNPEARRQHGIYCSTRCRVAAHRRRRRRQ